MSANTPNYAFTYPVGTDTPNGAAEIQTFATQVDTTLLAQISAVPRLVARATRTNNSSQSTTAAVSILRLSASLLVGRQYSIRTNALSPASTVTTDTAEVFMTFDVTGAAATTSSATLPGAAAFCSGVSSGGFPPLTLDAKYTPGSNLSISVLLGITRFSGSGGCYMFADGTRITDLAIYDVGPAVSDTGTGNTL